MYLTGFADEAATDIDGQIRATKELGWSNIESRSIGGKNIHDISDEDFDVAYGKLQDAGISINCFGSAIANWAKSVEEPFDSSLLEIGRAIPRMKRLGTKLVRVMSFSVLEGRATDDQLKEERFKRLRELTKMFLDEGIQPVHENCMNFGGMGWPYTVEMLENVPGLKLVFDTGNPVFNFDRSKPEPQPLQSSWEFYSNVKEHIAYVHVKDGVVSDEQLEEARTKGEPRPDCTYTYPGEGQANVEEIIADLLQSGYDGGISIEPHLAAVFHDDSVESDEEAKYSSYVEYGRRLEEIIRKISA